jgi:hypothetical protein
VRGLLGHDPVPNVPKEIIVSTVILSKCCVYIRTSGENLLLHFSLCKGEGKAIPLQAWRDPEGSTMLRLPGFKTVVT